MTEVAHGTNTKGMRTKATYDKSNQDFILHSPDFEAAKCWVGGLGWDRVGHEDFMYGRPDVRKMSRTVV